MSTPRHLPQLRFPEATYFVTWRLEDRGDRLAPAERTLVAVALEHFHQQRYRLAGYVVMDDHVHTVVFPLQGHELGQILHSWKSFTSQQINRAREMKGARWMKDSRTDVIRSEQHLRSVLQYIMDNPRKRWPEAEDYQWLKFFDVL